MKFARTKRLQRVPSELGRATIRRSDGAEGITESVETTAELDDLPHMSVVQFRGPGLGARNRLVWQLDEEWFAPGSDESVPSSYFPPEAFPAAVLWKATT